MIYWCRPIYCFTCVHLSPCYLLRRHVVVLSIGHPARSVLHLPTSSVWCPQTTSPLRLMVTVQCWRTSLTLAQVLFSAYWRLLVFTYEERHHVTKFLCCLHLLHTCGDELVSPLVWKQCKEIVLEMAKRLWKWCQMANNFVTCNSAVDATGIAGEGKTLLLSMNSSACSAGCVLVGIQGSVWKVPGGIGMRV